MEVKIVREQTVCSVLDHLGHSFLLRLEILLLLFFFVLLTLIRSHLSDFVSLFLLLLAKLVEVLLFVLLLSFLDLGRRRLLTIFLASVTSLIRDLQANYFVNQTEDRLKHLVGFFHGLLVITDLETSPHEDGVLIVDLLISNVDVVEAVAMLFEYLTDVDIDDLVSNFFVFS